MIAARTKAALAALAIASIKALADQQTANVVTGRYRGTGGLGL